MGTAFALRALLITSGSTLQEIQPQLSGVFAGTLAGIGGSLLAAVGGLVLDRVALSTANQSQDFIHRFILPTLPERRIAVRIEDAVLNVIAERAQAVAEKFHNTLQPVATELKEIADRCGEAAEAATKAFSEAARAVRDAGDLGNAARNFKSGAHMLDSSAEQFLAATKQTAEIVLRSGDLRASLSGLLERFQGVSQNLGSASERVGSQLAGQLAELKPHGQKLDTSVSALHSAMEALSTELVRRADADSAQLETAKTFVELSGRQMGDLARITQQTSDSVNVLRTALDTIDQKTLEAIRSEVNPLIIESMQQTKSALESLPGIFERHIETLSTQLTDSKPLPTRPDIDGVHDLAAALRDAVSEVKLASGAAARLADQLKQLDSNPEITTKKGIFQRFWNRGSDG